MSRQSPILCAGTYGFLILCQQEIDISDSFTPPLNEGKSKVTLFIEGYDLKGFKNHVTYEISC
jgi:hypothetical protein